MAQRADHDVAALHFGHAAAGELERVVARLVVEHLDGDEHALFARNLGAHANLLAEIGRECHRCDLIDDDRAHGYCPPARVWNMPGNAMIFENPSASAGVHSPAASPYLPRLAAINECGDVTPSTNKLPGLSCTRTLPLTRDCEDVSSASMSRHAGSSCLPS